MEKQPVILIVGGLSAGPAAAAKARRENEFAKIVLFEKGKNISYATCGMPYVLSGAIKTTDHLLVVRPEQLSQRFNVEVHLEEEAIKVDSKAQILTTNKDSYHYDKLIWATGASSNLPPIKGIENTEFASPFRSLEDLKRIQNAEAFANAKKIAVMGGGLIGVEVVENLRASGREVVLIEGGSQVLIQWSPEIAKVAQQEILKAGVELKLNTFVSEVKVNDSGCSKLTLLSNGDSIDADYLIFSTGIKANSQILIDEGAEVLPNKVLIINDSGETNLKNIYAAGDVASIGNSQRNEVAYLPMGTHSNKMGRTVGANAAGKSLQYKGGYGTAIIKLFHVDFARTGWNPLELKKAGIEFFTTTINAGATPSYYPNPQNLTIRIYYKKDGLILGAEAFGSQGVDKRIDVLATAIWAKAKVQDLPHLDLAYAPPFSSAKDAVAVAGYVAENQLLNKVDVIGADELLAKLSSGEAIELIDVRNPAELAKAGFIEGAKNIPLDDLRSRLGEIDKDKKLLIYCAGGMRAYLAVRILLQNGFDSVKNLEGGFFWWNKLGNPIKK